MSRPPRAIIGPVEFTPDGSGVVAAGPRRVEVAPVRVITDAQGARLAREGVALTPAFPAIDSFDYSPSRKEVAFSAKRGGSFDIGLVAIEGSDVSWVPDDPADETDVRWAPRGNKISYFVRGGGGDLVRTVHIPTSVALTVDFPFSVLRALVWDAAAERFAVTLDSAHSSPRVEVLRYSGEERRMAIPPAVRLDLDLVPSGAGAILLQPRSLGYTETLPLIVWITNGSPNAWDDARGALLQQIRAGCLITGKSPDDALWTSIRNLPWVDQDRIYVVDPTGNGQRATGNSTVITADAAVPPGHYRREGNLIRVQPAIVRSFAAGFIADHLKGTPRRAE